MTPETEKNVNEAIDWLQKTGGSIQDFAVEQAPLYCREVVQWQLWEGIVCGSAGVILCLLVILFWKLTRKVFNTHDYGNPAAIIPGIAGGLCAVFGTMALVVGSQKAIKAAVAPRLVIVEHLRGLKP